MEHLLALRRSTKDPETASGWQRSGYIITANFLLKNMHSSLPLNPEVVVKRR
jgi:hypothetical protein